MEAGGLIPHSQGFSNNPYPEPNKFLVLTPTSILSSRLRLGLPIGLFPVGLPVKILSALLTSILVTCPAHLNHIDLITLVILGERYKLRRCSLWSLLHSSFSSLLGPDIRFRILFSNTLIYLIVKLKLNAVGENILNFAIKRRK